MCGIELFVDSKWPTVNLRESILVLGMKLMKNARKRFMLLSLRTTKERHMMAIPKEKNEAAGGDSAMVVDVAQ